MSELHLSLEHRGTGSDGPGNDGLGDGTGLDSLDNTVLFYTSDLTKKNKDFALRISFVSKLLVSNESIAGFGSTIRAYLNKCSMKVVPGYLSPPMATPS